MSTNTVFIVFIVYTILIFIVSWFTSRKSNNAAYFTGNKRSPWFVVAYGMIGSSLSGVTFLSVPGDVYTTQFTYFGIVIGYIIGYLVIAKILLPLYYKHNLTSIYMYLENRFGQISYKSGSFFFIVSRLLGSALRMYLMIYILQEFIFCQWNIPIWFTATVFMVIILLYTFKAGIKTVVWTDTLQTTFLLAAMVITIFYVVGDLNLSFSEMFAKMDDEGFTKILNNNWRDHNFFIKQIVSGAFITIAMTGLDQDMMQKNLSCKNLKEAQLNMFTFSGILLVVNMLFLVLGGMLCVYSGVEGIAVTQTDRIFPTIALDYLPPIAGIIFMVGLVSAGYSSADGTLTALTTVVCYDFIGIEKKNKTEKQKVLIRRIIHICIGMLFLFIIIVFSKYHNDALIRILFNIASYTYGPLLGLFCFGMFTKRQIRDNWSFIPIFLSPVICFFLNKYSETLFFGYKFGFELLVINGLLVFFGLFVLSIGKHLKK